MSLWLEALKAAAVGQTARSRDLVNEVMATTHYLRVNCASDDCLYDGPLAKAVLTGIASFPADEREIAASRAEDLIDFIADLIRQLIERSIALVHFCSEHPEIDIDEVASGFIGFRRLKRSQKHLSQHASEMLASMLVLGVELNDTSAAVAQATAYLPSLARPMSFDERKLIKSMPVYKKWLDLKEREKLNREYNCYDLSEHEIAAETSDFSSFSTDWANNSIEKRLEFAEITIAIGRRLNQILGAMHDNKPLFGYRPIASHRVWWDLDPDGFLSLECVAPECPTDEVLAEYVTTNYPDVLNMNRLNAQRRRTKLEDACKDGVAEFYQYYARGTN